MTKKEYIERYGAEAYEEHKLIVKKRNYERYHNDKQFNIKHKETLRKRYNNDPEFREAHNAKSRTYMKERYNNDSEFRLNKINAAKKYRLRYVKDGRIDLIENYELAKTENFVGWDIHHKLEVNNDYINTVTDLKLMNLYYDRPPEELIWLTNSEHHALHMKMRNLKK